MACSRRRLSANMIEHKLKIKLYKLISDRSPIPRSIMMLPRQRERTIEEVLQLIVKWLRLQEGALELLPDGGTRKVVLN